MATDPNGVVVPVWTVATDVAKIQGRDTPFFDSGGLTRERVEKMRDALASFLDTPLVTIEAHVLPADTHEDRGVLLDAGSPLAVHLAELVKSSGTTLPPNVVSSSGETLYRMVVPAKLAAQMGTALRSMPSAAAQTGIHGGILGRVGLVGQATFVPVVGGEMVAAGGTAVAGAGGVALVTVAAPLVLLALATGASIYAEEQRRKAIQRVTDLLIGLHRSQLQNERDRLNGCQGAIEKATGVLMDEGFIGHSLGLDSAVNTIDTAIATATSRTQGWQRRLSALPEKGVDLDSLRKAFPGIGEPEGEFRVHLRLAASAIALKRRVAVLQAVEHAQQTPDQTFPRFVSALQREQLVVDGLESDLSQLLRQISRLRLRAPSELWRQGMLRREVDELLRWPGRLQELAEQETPTHEVIPQDVEIGMIRQRDGRLRVLPVEAIAS